MVSDIFSHIVLSRNYVSIPPSINESSPGTGWVSRRKQYCNHSGRGQGLPTVLRRAGRAPTAPRTMGPRSLRMASCLLLFNEIVAPPHGKPSHTILRTESMLATPPVLSLLLVCVRNRFLCEREKRSPTVCGGGKLPSGWKHRAEQLSWALRGRGRSTKPHRGLHSASAT